VAIFLVYKEKNILYIACPAYLVDSGMIPVSSNDASVSSIFRTGRPVLINNFSQHKHLSVFEIIRTPDDQIKPIWKLMGAVIATAEEKIGVIELSKRGAMPDEVGVDFSQEELKILVNSINKFAPFIKRAMPDNFRGKIS
jgi:hypothetical protein